ncbi:NlpC/P60 family protein [Amycolatopsis sp. cg9]|uniref:NlpC/P60 family protein n=1 Tax=Amycolatopsis sp. cg9 TaxID=3238801 RepID=UPI0035243FAB
MARFTAEQIYGFAREAGFSPDRAATMTAIALAESGGSSGAHNPHGEDSRGLWQINVRSHAALGRGDLYDPLTNAKAAYAVSHGGADISPWTTTHGGLSARYLRYRAQAEAAAVAYGDGDGHGMWTGTAGYGDHVGGGSAAGGGKPSAATTGDGSDAVVVAHPADNGGAAATAGARDGEEYGIPLDDPPPADGVHTAAATAGTGARAGQEYGIPLGDEPPATTSPPAGDRPAGTGDPGKLQRFLDVAVAQTGDHYVWGARAGMNDPDPTAFDCSDLVQWATHQVGVELPRTAWQQYEFLHKQGYTIPVEQAIHTPGALLFSFSSDPDKGLPAHNHVAISLGNGKTMEAKGTQYGVGSWEANTKRFQYAVVIPGVSDGQAAAHPAPAPAAHVVDDFQHHLDTDPAALDADPAVLTASRHLTAAEPAPHVADEHVEPADTAEPEQLSGTLDDIDHDGVDDALHHAEQWSAHFDDHPADHHDVSGAH